MDNASDHNAAALRSLTEDGAAYSVDTLSLLDIVSRSLAYLMREMADRDPDRAKRHHYLETAARLDELRAPILHHLATLENAS